MDGRRQDVPPAPAGDYFIPYPTVPQSTVTEISLAELWSVLKTSRARIALITVGSIVIAVAVAFLLPPIYRAEVLLAPVSDDQSGAAAGLTSQLGGIASLAGISLGGSGGGKDEFIAILQSRVLSDFFVRENNLLPILFEDDWDAAAGKWKSSDPADVPTLWDAFKLMEKKVRQIAVDKKTGLVTLSIEWKDPELAAHWTEGLVKRTNAYLRQQAVQHAERNLAYLQDQARKTTSVELQQAIYRLMETEVKKAMLANVNEEYAFKVLDPAVVPEEKVRPKRLIIIGVGGVLGFLAACATTLMQMRPRARGKQAASPESAADA